MTTITGIQCFMLCVAAMFWSRRGFANHVCKIAMLAAGLAPLIWLAVVR